MGGKAQVMPGVVGLKRDSLSKLGRRVKLKRGNYLGGAYRVDSGLESLHLH